MDLYLSRWSRARVCEDARVDLRSLRTGMQHHRLRIWSLLGSIWSVSCVLLTVREGRLPDNPSLSLLAVGARGLVLEVVTVVAEVEMKMQRKCQDINFSHPRDHVLDAHGLPVFYRRDNTKTLPLSFRYNVSW